MCSSPLTKDGNTFSCNRCDDCIAARRVDWTARAMAERAISPYTALLCLTYGNDTQEQRDGARMFRYADIQILLANIRRQIAYHHGLTNAVRFICAGEQGSRHGRCHWHIIIYSAVPLCSLGVYTGPSGAVVPADRVTTTGNVTRRLRWSLWPHGLMTSQEPDQGGMAYALKYALKDQFAADKSAGTGRFTKSDAYATGFFRMSKRPPIGWGYLEQRLADWEEAGNVPPSLLLSIPDAKLRWYPRGATRRWLLDSLRQLNDRIKDRTGANAPQWSSLLAHCKDNPSDMEILQHGEESEAEESEELILAKKARYQRDESERAQYARRCGSTVACSACLRALGLERLAERGVEVIEQDDGAVAFRYAGDQTSDRLAGHQRDGKGGGINALCGLKESARLRSIFVASLPERGGT